MLDKTRRKLQAREDEQAQKERRAARLAAVTKAIKQHQLQVEEIEMTLPVGFGFLEGDKF